MMSSPHKKINSLEELLLEKHLLKERCTYQEKLISYKFDELKNNFPEIVSQAVLPFAPDKNREVTSLLDLVNDFILRLLPLRFRNNPLARFLLKTVQALVIR